MTTPRACPICAKPFVTPEMRAYHAKDNHGVTLLISTHDQVRAEKWAQTLAKHPLWKGLGAPADPEAASRGVNLSADGREETK